MLIITVRTGTYIQQSFVFKYMYTK